MSKRYLYESNESHGLQAHEIVAESEKSFLIRWQFNGNEWIAEKSEISNNYIDGKRFSYIEETAKLKLDRIIIPALMKKLEIFKSQL